MNGVYLRNMPVEQFNQLAINYYQNSIKTKSLLEGKRFGVIKVRRGSHIKRLSLRMAVGRGVWVCVPPGVGRRMVASFLEENREWLMRNREQVERREQEGGVGLGIGAEIATKLHVLKIEETMEREPSYRIEGKVFRLLIPKGMDFRRIEGIVGKFLVEVYRLEAKQYLPQFFE